MNILIISPGYLPVPALKGGAVENLIDTIISENEKNPKMKIDVFSIYNSIPNTNNYTNMIYINDNTFKYKLGKVIRSIINRIPNIYIGNKYISEVYNKMKKMNLNKYNCIIIENNPLFALKIKKICKCPLYLHLHNDKLSKESKLAKKVLEKYDKIITVSDYISKRVNEIKKTNNCVTLYNGINIKRFAVKIETLNDNFIQENKLGNSFIYLYTGRILKIKGVHEAVKAFNKLNSELKDIKFIIIGEFGEDRYSKKVQKEIAKNKNNIITTGRINNNEIDYFYKISNVQLVPSMCNEALGNTAIEGISAGLTVIVSNRGGLPEVVSPDAGIIINSDNIEENLVEEMRRCYKNEKMLNHYKMKALEKSKQFDTKKFFNKFYKIVSFNK